MALGKKTGGRKIGSTNKIDRRLPIEEMCAAKKCSPVDVLLEFLTGEDAGYRFQAARELMQYLYPKRTANSITLESYTPEELIATAEKKLNDSEAEA